MRFEAVPNLRAEWDLDYDPRPGRIAASNIYAGYSHGITTVGLGHALLNAVDEQGTAAALVQSQQVEALPGDWQAEPWRFQSGRQRRL